MNDLVSAFGAERMIYGGGFNKDATGKSYQGYRERVQQLLSHLSTADQEKILGHNALKLYRFGS